MPYVITTRRSAARLSPGQSTFQETAVATPDEARQAIIDIGAAHDTWIGGDALHGPIDRNGGTMGPLPDGTVIEVRQVSWSDLASTADWQGQDPSPYQALILNAWNKVIGRIERLHGPR